MLCSFKITINCLLQANSAPYCSECLLSGSDADIYARSDGENCACHGNGLPMHVSSVSHVLRLWWIHAGYHWVML